MNKAIIQCTDVRKDFPIYHHFTGGIKSFLFHFPTAIKEMRKSRFTALKNINFEDIKAKVIQLADKKTLINFFNAKLPKHMVPKRITFEKIDIGHRLKRA